MVHGKQFAILPEALKREGYRHLTLPDGMVLSYHEALPVVCSKENDALLLGHAWSAYPSGESPAEAIARIGDEAALLREECGWCGRYVLVLKGSVYTDTSASMPVFYSTEGLSSDISFLVGDGHPRSELRLAGKTKWYPGPATAYEGISRLLPSQAYQYREKSLRFRNPLSPRVDPGQSYEELKTRFCELLAASAENMQRHFGKARLLVALTGGYDSRLSFAALCHGKETLAFSAYTLEHDNISEEDRQTPSRLCELTHVPYYYGKREKERFSEARNRAYIEHLSGMVAEEDQRFYAFGQYDALLAPGETGVLLRSNLYPVAAVSVTQQRAVGVRVDLNDFLANYEIAPGSPMARAFEDFFAWTKAHPLPIADTHRFYWEQKMACWSAENDRGYDIYDNLIPIQMGNCRDLITMLLCMPEEKRTGKAHQAEMSAALCPQIADIPYGSGQSGAKGKLGRALETAGKVWHKTRNIGLARSFRYYLSKLTRRD